jgi:tetratricopeptide (TPR) repeat protein
LAGLRDTLAAVDRVEPKDAPFVPAVTMAVMLVPCAGQWVPAFEETALIGRQVGRARALGHVWSTLASAYRLDRDLVAALAAVQRSVAIFDRLGDDGGRALSLHQQGCVERDLGRFADARTHLTQALRLRRRLGDLRGENLTLANMGIADAAAGDVDGGRRLAWIALRQGEEVDDGPGVGGILLDLAVVERFAGDLPRGRRLAEQAVEAFRPQGYTRLTGWSLQFAGELALADGDPDAARRRAAEAAVLFARADCRLGRSRAAGLAR